MSGQEEQHKTCYIFGASEVSGIKAGLPAYVCPHFTPEKGRDTIIAADAGYLHARALGLEPDIMIGDFDSIGKMPESGAEIIKFPPEKDDTDLMLAVKCGAERGHDRFVIYGALGGKIDFTLANMQILTYMAEAGMDAYMIGQGAAVTAVKNGRISFNSRFKGRISVLSMRGTAKGVTIKGLKYTLENGALACDVPLGVSNEFTGRDAFAEALDGTIAVIYGASNGAASKEYGIDARFT